MSKYFKRLTSKGYPLIDFLNDIAEWGGLPPKIICITYSDIFEGEVIVGEFIWNDEDRSYYKIETKGKPRTTLGELFSLTDHGNLNTVIVHGPAFILSIFNANLGRNYSAEIDFPKWEKWIEKYHPNRFAE